MSTKMADETYVALYRKLLYNGHFRLPHVGFKIFVYLLIIANRFPNEKLRLDVGECWVSYSNIQSDCSEEGAEKISRATVSKMLTLLEGRGYIQRFVTKGIGMKIKVVNYEKYQDLKADEICTSSPSEPPPVHTVNHTSSSSEPPLVHSVNTNNKVSNNINKLIPPKLKFSEEQIALAIFFRTLLIEKKPDMKITGSAEKWANEIRLMVEQDGRKLVRIREVMLWANADSFWQNNILSIAALRKNFDALELRMEKINKQPEKKKYPHIER